MKELVTNIRADKIVLRGLIISAIFMVLTLFFILINFKNLPPFLPIFNQLPWGTQRLTQTYGIFIPTVIFIFVFIFNLALSSLVYSKNPLVARMIVAINLIIAVINFLFTIRTIILLI
jgi:hypothetical protein